MMGYGYGEGEIRRRLVDALGSSKSGMSGTELAHAMNVSRITLAKYLASFEQYGLVKSRPAGNVTIWYMGNESSIYTFPDDYFRVESEYRDIVVSGNGEGVFSLIQNCIHSGARPMRLIVEVVIPTLKALDRMYEEGRLGGLERAHLQNIISRSLHHMDRPLAHTTATKNCLLLAAGLSDVMSCQMAATALRSEEWTVSMPGDISSSVDVFFDLDMRKLLSRIWKGVPGVMIIVVFGGDAESLRFLAGSVNDMRKNSIGTIHLAFCSRTNGKRLGSDMVTENLADVVQWCETVHKNL